MVKVGDIYREYVSGEHWADWIVIELKDSHGVKCVKAYNENSIPAGHIQVVDLNDIQNWIERGWFVLDKESNVIRLLNKIDMSAECASLLAERQSSLS